jgi:hypothetical protein
LPTADGDSVVGRVREGDTAARRPSGEPEAPEDLRSMCGCRRAAGSFVESAMALSDDVMRESPTKEPIVIEYKRWRNFRSGYEVIVLGVHHRMTPEGLYLSAVTVQGNKVSSTLRVVWPAGVFLRAFEPLGRKLKMPTQWERLKA